MWDVETVGDDTDELGLEDFVAIEGEIPKEPAASGGEHARPVEGEQMLVVAGLLGVGSLVPHLRLLHSTNRDCEVTHMRQIFQVYRKSTLTPL